MNEHAVTNNEFSKEDSLQLVQNSHLRNADFLIDFSEKFSGYAAGNDFFQSLIKYLTELTKLDYVFAGELNEAEDGHSEIKTISVTAFGKIADNFTYPLPDGPCEQVIKGTLYAYPKFCRLTFPKNKTIADFNVEGYIGYPLYNISGKAFGLIAVMHEKEIENADYISALLKFVAKRAEFELDRLKYETDLININQRLEQKNRELQRSNDELAAFSFIASHDLQEPLRKIQAFTSRINDLENKGLSSEAEGYLSRIEKTAARAKSLINDLILYSKTNISQAIFQKADLNLLLEKVKDDLKDSIEENKAVFEQAQLPALNVIEFQIEQLFTNLISNSLKFSDGNTPPIIKITYSLTDGVEINAENKNGKYHKITFLDNGIGFNQDYADKIFGIFQRLHTNDVYTGTGIGLTICRKIVENHNGFIQVKSSPGEGASFNIFIPAN